jgi:phosphotransacetylase
MGMARPVHLLPLGAEVELIVKVAAIAVVDAQETEEHGVKLEHTEVPAT